MRFSVVIPVYNGEQTIERCLDSILCQNYPDTEILLINDGSTDRTDEICIRYSKQFPSIKYYSKPNGGVSSARNFALSRITGEYVLFVDSDDYVENRFFDTIDNALHRMSFDLLFFSWRTVSPLQTKETILQETTIYGAENIAKWAYITMKNGGFGSLWTKVFRADIIKENGLSFNEALKIAEDWSFIFQYILFSNTLQTTSDILYNVSLANPESLSRKRRDYLCEQLFEANMDILRRMENKPQAVKRVFSKPFSFSFYRSVYSASKELQRFHGSYSERKKEIQAICRKYSEARISPSGLKNALIAIPVWLRLSWVIDRLVSH